MSLLHRFLATGAPAPQTYSDDVFSAYTYSGSNFAQTITTGIDLLTYGGMLWLKGRNVGGAYSYGDHELFDTSNVGSTRKWLRSDGTDALGTNGSIATTPFTTSGFNLTAGPQLNNRSGDTNVGWTFRKAPKFFDVVTYTGNGASNRVIAHSLNCEVGMLVIKVTSTTGDWLVYHRSLGASDRLVLNTTAARDSSNQYWLNDATENPTTTSFKVGGSFGAPNTNVNGNTYVAYLFAHDTSATGLIQCGSFTTDGSGNATVNLGWEPQYLMYKTSSSAARSWDIVDSTRGFTDTALTRLFADLSSAESVAAGKYVTPTATGFKIALDVNTTFIYLAIRRPNKPPTLGTQVYNAIARTGTSAPATVTGIGFAPDLMTSRQRNGADWGDTWRNRLVGIAFETDTSISDPEVNSFTNNVLSFGMNDVSVSGSSRVNGAFTYIYKFFKRAPNVFDTVCYTGNQVDTSLAHNLGVIPDLIIVKSRSNPLGWWVYHAALGSSQAIQVNSLGGAVAASDRWGGASPTSTTFRVGTNSETNASNATYTAYLFATAAGISKVGSYTGNGSSQTINAGFTTGARFILIKRTDSTGDWYVWNSATGISAGTDPHLSLNTTAAEVTTDDSVDTDTSGFIVNQLAATNINVNAATYIYLSFA